MGTYACMLCRPLSITGVHRKSIHMLLLVCDHCVHLNNSISCLSINIPLNLLVNQCTSQPVCNAVCFQVRVYAAHPEGVVTVKFKQEEPAHACVAKMNGRFFGGRQLIAHMWDGFTYYHVSRETCASGITLLYCFTMYLTPFCVLASSIALLREQ